MISALTFTIKTALVTVTFELTNHHLSGKDDFVRNAINPIVVLSAFILLRQCLLANVKFAEDYGTFILNMIMMTCITDTTILLSPTQYNVSPM